MFWSKTTNATEIKWHNGTSILIPDKNKECVFPFEFLGKIHSKCTLDYSCSGCYWCGTTKNVTDHSGWGMCNEICPREKREFCLEFLKTKFSILIDKFC